MQCLCVQNFEPQVPGAVGVFCFVVRIRGGGGLVVGIFLVGGWCLLWSLPIVHWVIFRLIAVNSSSGIARKDFLLLSKGKLWEFRHWLKVLCSSKTPCTVHAPLVV
uniref:Transmembrane protein n=1 Tax=Eutreptiella gymnastica TaxID=73025 RepID=A0A7S4LKF6_9EUGL